MVLQHEVPPGTGFACHSSGWMQLDNFTDWFEQFAKPTDDDLAILFLDGHITHTKNLYFLQLHNKTGRACYVCLHTEVTGPIL